MCIDLLLKDRRRMVYEAELNPIKSLSLDVLKSLVSNVQDLDKNDASPKIIAGRRTKKTGGILPRLGACT